MRVGVFTAIVGLAAVGCGGCIVPVPHWRVQAYGVTGQVVNASDSRPIGGALVASVDEARQTTHSDRDGKFRLRAKRRWHALYFIGPISQSLLPDWDVTPRARGIRVSAPGHLTTEFSIAGFRDGHGHDVPAVTAGAYLHAGQFALAAAGDDFQNANTPARQTRAGRSVQETNRK